MKGLNLRLDLIQMLARIAAKVENSHERQECLEAIESLCRYRAIPIDRCLGPRTNIIRAHAESEWNELVERAENGDSGSNLIQG